MAEMYSKNGRALSSTQNLKGEPTEIESSKKFNANNAFLTQLKKDEFLNGSIPITLNSKGEYVTDLVFNNIMKIRQDDKFPKKKDDEDDENNNENFISSVRDRKRRKEALKENTALREELTPEEEEFLNTKLGEALHHCLGDDYIGTFCNTEQGFTIGQDHNMQAVYGNFIQFVLHDREALARKIFSPKLLEAYNKYITSRHAAQGINADSMFFERLKLVAPRKFGNKKMRTTYHSVNTVSGLLKSKIKHENLCLEVDGEVYTCIDSKQRDINTLGQTTFRKYAHRGNEEGEAFTSEVVVYQTPGENGIVCYGQASYGFAPETTKTIDIDGTLPFYENNLRLTVKTPCNTHSDEKVALCFSNENTTPPKVRYGVVFGEGKDEMMVSMEDLHKMFNCCSSFSQWMNDLKKEEGNRSRIMNTKLAKDLGLTTKEGAIDFHGMEDKLRRMHDVYETARDLETKGLIKYNGENVTYASAMPYEPLVKHQQPDDHPIKGTGGVNPLSNDIEASDDPHNPIPSPSPESLQDREENERKKLILQKTQEKPQEQIKRHSIEELFHNTQPKEGIQISM